jgi:hypothetical protein
VILLPLYSLLADGKIFFKDLDRTFDSPSRAGKEITGREIDGWKSGRTAGRTERWRR